MGKRTVEQVRAEILKVKGQVFDILKQMDLHNNSLRAYGEQKNKVLVALAKLEQEEKVLVEKASKK